MTTYKIEPTPSGAYVSFAPLYAVVTPEGRLSSGNLPRADHWEAVQKTALEVMRTGAAARIDLDRTDDAAAESIDEERTVSPVCPNCGTWCYGDCQSH